MEELPNDVLALIFQQLDLHERKDKLPLVCKRFASLLARPSQRWKGMTLHIPQGSRLRVDTANCLRWFGLRRPAVGRLVLRGGFDRLSGTHDTGSPSHTGSSFGAALLSSLSTDLRSLSLDSVPARRLHLLSPFTQLEELDLRCVSGLATAACLQPLQQLQQLKSLHLLLVDVQPPGVGPAAMPTHSFLPQQLKELTLILDKESDPLAAMVLGAAISRLLQLELLILHAFHLTELPAALLKLTNLTNITLDNCDGVGTGHTLQRALSGLTKLTSLALLDMNVSAAALPIILGAVSTGLEDLCLLVDGEDVACLPVELAGFTALRSLDLRFQGLQGALAHAALASLPLTRLDLSLSNLAAVPAAVRDLTTLRTLILSSNDHIKVPEGPYLAHLTHLTLEGCELRRIPQVLRLASQLVVLDLSMNHRLKLRPTHVNLVVDHLTALQQLDLSGCWFDNDSTSDEDCPADLRRERVQRHRACMRWVSEVDRRVGSGRTVDVLI